MDRPELRQGCLIGNARLRLGRDAPARHRRDRLRALLLRQLLGAPAPQQEAGNVGLLRRQLQAARGAERENADLRHHRRQGAAAQGFLERPAHLRIAPRRDQDQPAQVEPKGGKAGSVEIVLLCHPDDPASRCAGFQRHGEKGRSCGALFLIADMAGDFMDGAEANCRLIQIGIDQGETGRQPAWLDTVFRPQSRDAGNTLFELGQVDPSIHGSGQSFACSLFVLNRPRCQAAAKVR